MTRGDIVITSTASTEYVLQYDMIKGLLRKRRNRPLFIIDIAVPRDAEPKINELENVFLYDIDDLKSIIEANIKQRRQEAVKAERIIEEEVIKFDLWLKELAVVPTIIALKEKMEKIRQMEISKSLPQLGEMNEDQIKALEILTTSLVDKVITDPILFLKGRSDRPNRDTYLDITRRLFRLDEEGQN
jgi:glutamyl-tRNA reductase